MNLFGIRKSPITNPADFQYLYEHHRLAVFRYIYGLTGGPQEEAEDLTAETFLRAWKARHRFEGEIESAIGWLLKIAKRLVIDGYRRSSRRTPSGPSDLVLESTPEQVALSAEQKIFLFRLMEELSGEQRELLILRYMLGWRVTDIAAHLSMTENNISVIIHRTLSKLRERWMDYDAESMSVIFVTKEKVS
ncbi:MAG TPA: sigma-70 family RNA polymerase sigma factor [Anaerolineales bacterium]|nr:sigma-70 family RNA polymerase sigma factor [Anaerolineales bacterium]